MKAREFNPMSIELPKCAADILDMEDKVSQIEIEKHTI